MGTKRGISKKAKMVFSSDEKMDALSQAFPVSELVRKKVFSSLVESIISQQISVQAAKSINKKFKSLFGRKRISPKNLLLFDIEEIRAAGVSRQKANYLLNIAHFFIEHKITDQQFDDMPNEAIIQLLTEIKGVGRWTVQMILIFSLCRDDVFPSADLGIQKACREHYMLVDEKKGLILAMEELSQKWKPFRSLATRVLWASL